MSFKQLPFIMFLLLCIGITIAAWRVDNVMTNMVSFPAIEQQPVVGTAVSNAPLTLYNFFASWCTPCLAEIPYLEQIQNEGRLPIVGFSWDKKNESLTRWLKKHGNPYHAIYDDHNGAIGNQVGIMGLPESFLVDEKGRIVYHLRGPITPKELQIIQSHITLSSS